MEAINLSTFLSQAYQPTVAWFLKIAFIQEVSMGVCVCVFTP